MKQLVTRLLTGSLVYGVSSMLSRSAAIFLVPLYTHYLSPAEFGELHFILAAVGFFKLIINLGLTTSFWKFYSDERADRASVLSNIVLCQLYLGLGTVLAGYALQTWWFPKVELLSFLLILATSETLGTLYETILLLLRADHQAKKYAQVTLFYTACFVACNVVFLSVLRLGLGGVVFASGISYLLAIVTFSGRLRGRMGGALDTPLIKKIVRYGVPIMLSNVAGAVVSLSDRLVLKLFVTDHELGLYSFGFKIGDIVKMLLITPFFLAWNPLRWEIYRDPNGQATFGKVYALLFSALTFGGLCLIGLGPLFCLVLASKEEFQQGLAVAPLIGFANILYGLYYYNAMGLLFENRTHQIFIIVFAGSIISLVCNFVLASAFGIYGPAFSAVISYLTMYIAGTWASQRCYPVNRKYLFEFSCVAVVGVAALAMSFASAWVEDLYQLSLISLVVALVYLPFCLAAGGLSLRHATAAMRLVRGRAKA